MGYLKRFGDKKYRIIYGVLPEKGRRRQKRETLDGVSKKQAEAILAQREAEIARQRKSLEQGNLLSDEIRLADLFEEFLEQKRAQKEETTVRRYETLVRLYLKPKFGEMQAKHLRPHHLMAAYSEWLGCGCEGRTVSAKTIRHAHELMRNVLNWGVRRELLSRNVATLISGDDLPKVVTRKPLGLTEDEVRILLHEAKNPTKRARRRGYLSSQSWFYPAVALAVYTGARRGEIVGLRWSDISLERRSVTIARSLTERMTFKTPKNDKTRTLIISESLCAILRSHRATQAQERLALGRSYKDDDLVFARSNGSAVDPWNFARAVRDLVLRSGVTPVTLHGLRDTHASLCAKAGVPLEVVSQRLGHASIGITASRYLHVYSDRDADAADAFGRLVG